MSQAPSLLCMSYAAIHFQRRVWYHMLSLRYACIRSLGIILIPQATFVPNSVSFAASTAELAHGEYRVLNHSVNYSPSLYDALGTEAFASE